MQLHLLSFTILCVALTVSAAPAEIEERDNVGVCEAVLIALKASSFCSSFINLRDATSIYTKSANPTVSTKTITAGCVTSIPGGVETITSESITITTTTATFFEGEVVYRFMPRAAGTMSISAETPVPTAAPLPAPGFVQHLILRLFNRAPAASQTTTTTSAASAKATTATSTAAASCQIAGLPVSLKPFACSVISGACSAYVHPHTTTTTQTITPTSVTTTSVSGICSTITGPASVITITETSTMTILTVFTTASVGG